jgi:sn-glycerol 3-phosphate transport system substrate-binding protein
MIHHQASPTAGVTRRRLLANVGLGSAVASLLAACGGTSQATITTAAAAASTTSPAAASTVAAASATSTLAPTTTASTSATSPSAPATTLTTASTTLTAAAPTTTAAAGVAPSKAGLTITYVSNLPSTHPEGKERLALLQEFNKTNTDGIAVNLDQGQGATDLQKDLTLAAGGTPPDLAYLAYYETASIFVSGATIDIDAELRTVNGWEQQKGDMFPNMLATTTWTGKLVGLSGYTNNQAIIYSPQLLSQLGITPPKADWNWQDFSDLVQKGNKPPDRWGYDTDWGDWSGWLGSAGGHPISDDGQKVTMTTPEAQDALTYRANLAKIGVTPPKAAGELFNKTKGTGVVFEYQGPYRIPTLRQNGVTDFAVVPLPIKKTAFAGNGGHAMVVFKGVPADRKHAAAQVAMWMNAPHAQAQMCIHATSLPVSKMALQSKELQDYLGTDPQFKGFVDLAPYGWRWPALPSYPKISAAIQSAVNDIYTGKASVQDGLTKGQQDAQVLLDQDLKLQ